jgi:hypothetical protein
VDQIEQDTAILSKTENVSAEAVRDGCHQECNCHDECDMHDDCQGFASDIDKTVRCFWELRRLAHEVCRCLRGAPSEKRLLTIYTCLILEDINSVCKEVMECKKLLCCKEKRDADLTLSNEIFHPNVTSGTVFITKGQTEKIRVVVLNHAAMPKNVRVKVLDNSVNPNAVLDDVFLEVGSFCSSFISQTLGSAASYEIQVFDLVPGMTVSAVEEENSGRFVDGTALSATAFMPYLGVCP